MIDIDTSTQYLDDDLKTAVSVVSLVLFKFLPSLHNTDTITLKYLDSNRRRGTRLRGLSKYDIDCHPYDVCSEYNVDET